MTKERLEAFSDGVIAIIITIMVLELHIPDGGTWADFRQSVPGLVIYVMSFIYIGIYWTNHHHMFRITERVNGTILWVNLVLLFWLSLVPFVTAWMGESHFASLPMAAYGVVLLCAAISYTILQTAIIRYHGPDSRLALAVRGDVKGKLSLVLYIVAIPLAFVHHAIAGGIYILVALIWLVPDRRIEVVATER